MEISPIIYLYDLPKLATSVKIKQIIEKRGYSLNDPVQFKENFLPCGLLSPLQ